MLGAAVAFWVAGFDFFYALFDEEIDRREGLHSIVTRFGVRRRLPRRAARPRGDRRVPRCGRARPARRRALLARRRRRSRCCSRYEHSLVRPGDLRRLDTAFFTMNGVISVVFAAFVIARRGHLTGTDQGAVRTAPRMDPSRQLFGQCGGAHHRPERMRSRSGSAAAQRAGREACVRVERAAHRGDDPPHCACTKPRAIPDASPFAIAPFSVPCGPGALALDPEAAERRGRRRVVSTRLPARIVSAPLRRASELVDVPGVRGERRGNVSLPLTVQVVRRSRVSGRRLERRRRRLSVRAAVRSGPRLWLERRQGERCSSSGSAFLTSGSPSAVGRDDGA